jgi:hypothetical protein
MTVERALTSLAHWIRRGHPLWAPRRGHVALIALCGRDVSLDEVTPPPPA